LGAENQAGIPKSESRNPKEIQNPKPQWLKQELEVPPRRVGYCLEIGYSGFGIP